ncbi:MAG: hypothetical protein QY312_02300 [Candidatus Dojkabacteria bacterium]|nr:MAG: hypothetical protein QY312_02300 [Candidatus Dojkabacteria bacterium]
MTFVQQLYASAGQIIGNSQIPTGYVEPSSAPARIAAMLNLFFIFCAILATFFIIRGGIDYIMSAGEAGKVKNAQGAIQYAIIGLIVAAVGWLVVRIVAGILGYSPDALNLPL